MSKPTHDGEIIPRVNHQISPNVQQTRPSHPRFLRSHHQQAREEKADRPNWIKA